MHLRNNHGPVGRGEILKCVLPPLLTFFILQTDIKTKYLEKKRKEQRCMLLHWLYVSDSAMGSSWLYKNLLTGGGGYLVVSHTL